MMKRMDGLFDKGTKLTERIGVMERRIRGAVTAYAVLVAKGFIREGFEVYTYGNFTSACIHEGGLPAILVKGLPKDALKRWEDKASLLWVSSYDEFTGEEPQSWVMKGLKDKEDLVRLTMDNIEVVAREEWGK